MNADQLLAHYEKIADAPEAIPRLRRFILDLAVRGKLVPQDPNDEPASELLKRIAAEKARLERAGEARKRKELPVLADTEAPFALPNNWNWVRLGELGVTQTGTTPSKNHSDHFGNHIPFIKPTDIKPTHVDYSNEGLSEVGITASGRLAVTGSILMVCIGTIGKCQMIDRDCSFNQQINSLSPIDDLESLYLLAACQSDFFQEAAWEASARTTIAILNKGKWEKLPIPLPPLAEQRRIVAKLDELMVLCDRLEVARAEREATRDRVTAASLAHLNRPDPDEQTFRDHAGFALDNLAALTTRPDQIKALRQTILNLAVRGHLSANTHWPSEAEQVGQYRKLQNGYAFKSSWFSKMGIRLMRNANIGHGTIRWDETVYLPADREKEFERFHLRVGDIVLTLDRPFIVTGTKVARVTEADTPSLLLQRVGRFVETEPGLSDEYLFLWIHSPHFNDQINPGRSNGVPHISSKQVEAAEIFVPPLAEQHRIVAKVDELMALCDRLEASLNASAATRRRLLNALLHATLNPEPARTGDCRMTQLPFGRLGRAIAAENDIRPDRADQRSFSEADRR